MKRLLFFVGLIGAPLFAGIASDNLIKGLELVKRHKSDWFKFEKELHNAKYKLIEAEHNKMFDQKISTIKQFNDGNMNEYEETMLTNVLASHKAHMKEWHDMSTSFNSKAQSIYERQLKELATFEASLKPAQEEPIAEVEMEEVELE